MNGIPRPRLPPLIFELLNGLVFATTLLGAGLISLLRPTLVVGALIGLVLLAIYLYVAFARYNNNYDFRLDSPRYIRFFANWYARPGHHIIFCDDLHWMESVEQAPIKEALANQHGNATICVREAEGAAFDYLTAAGVHIRTVANEVDTHSRLSIVVHDGIRDMIVRISSGDNQRRIRWRRFTDRFSIGLALDLVNNACPEVRPRLEP